jgi:hypothetical protein
LGSASFLANAHFRLLAPASWVTENNLGDPQKAGPCGVTSENPGTPTNIVTRVRGGDKLHIQIQETIFHPGHYRIALAASPADLPPDPDVITTDSEKGPRSVSAPIQDAPRPPILADGLFTHTTKRTDLFEADVEIPNINCDKCTLQTTQFMAQHGYNNPGGYHYHHCANLQITADPSKPLNGAWPGIR